MSEFETEPIRGLPEKPPAGERILWQGAPRWRVFARRAFRSRLVAAYFAILVVWSAASLLHDGAGLGAVAVKAAWLIALASLAGAIGALLAWAICRTTVYTITNRRLVIRFGVALPMSINIPFRLVSSAGLKRYADGSGDIALTLNRGQRIAYFVLWPHVRPWRFARPQPSLRAISKADRVAEILAQALAGETASAASPARPDAANRPAATPAGGALQPSAA